MGSAGNDEWDWSFSPRADDQFARLESDIQERIVSKLDEVVSSEWREPGDFLEPLTGSPYQKLRVGDYRLGCRMIQDEKIFRVESIRKRSGAYTADD
jgi:mRNA-degrading endonuclease RelE of RelBE toxin-antitoxin system